MQIKISEFELLNNPPLANGLVPIVQNGSNYSVAVSAFSNQVTNLDILNAVNGSSIATVRGVHVDDFYLEEDADDHAPSIRRAIVYAFDNNINQVTFSPKVYNIQSNVVGSTPTGDADCGLVITNTILKDHLVFEGNGASLFKHGTDYAPMMYIRALIKNITIRNLNFIRDHLDIPFSQAIGCCGLWIDPVLAAPDIDMIDINNCIFEDCHRSINIGMVGNSVFLNGRNKNCRISKNQFLYPRGCNLTDGGGGGQCLYVSQYTDNLILLDNIFDGATTGDVSGNTNPRPIDGFNLTEANNTILRGNILKNFDFEGILCGRQLIYASSLGAFTVPDIGVNFSFNFYPNYSTAGWQIGDRFRFLLPGTPTPITFNNEVEVVSVDSNTRLTAKLVSGATFEITDEMWIVHQKYWLEKSSVLIADNLFTRTVTAPTTGAHAAITCVSIDECTIVGNIITDGYAGMAIIEAIADGLRTKATITGNSVAVENSGIGVSIGCLPCNISGNTITLTGISHTGVDYVIGIQNFANGSIISNNIVLMPEAVGGEGIGVNLRQNVNDVIIVGNVFKNVDVDVNNNGVINISHSYTDNILINVANPQTRFPTTYANDSAAAAGGIPIKGIYFNTTGGISWRQT